MEFTPTQIKYLVTIYALNQNGLVRSMDVAQQLEVSRPSVHRMLLQLEQEGLITKQPYSVVKITQSGEAFMKQYYWGYCLITRFLQRNLPLGEAAVCEGAFALLGEVGPAKLDELCRALTVGNETYMELLEPGNQPQLS
ncbi:MAG: MarR family transcriptional regulator [Oscillospiraceae bacterium]|nr:MarR family transcriptional regulator [Oscillospiraceae bacterium]